MRLIITGGRDYRFTSQDTEVLDWLRTEFDVSTVVSGGDNGADLCGEIWAEYRNIPVDRYPAQWGIYGRKSRLIRSLQMARNADAVILFPGGRGTASMRAIALQEGLMVFDDKGGIFNPPSHY